MTDEVEEVTATPADEGDVTDVTDEEPKGEPTAGDADADDEQAADEAGEDQETDEVDDPEKGKNQKKLAELSYQARELRRQNERLMSALMDRQQQGNGQAEKKPTPPKLEDFDSLEEYMAADYEYRDAKRRHEQQPKVDPRQALYDQHVANAKQQLMFEGTSKHDDFMSVVRADHVQITDDMVQTIIEMDMDSQIDVTYFLGKNPGEAFRISQLPPRRQAIELGKLETRLSSPQKPTKRPSKAPDPVKPVQSKKTASNNPSDNDDIETWVKKRNAELARQ